MSIAEQVCTENERLRAINAELIATLKMAHKAIQHRNGDCYSNDYMGVCVCGKDKIKAVLLKVKSDL
jgi:hypothetical protein